MKSAILLGLVALANLVTCATSIRPFGVHVHPVTDMTLGADRDGWGCITSAGYSWCNHTESCTPSYAPCGSFAIDAKTLSGTRGDRWGCVISNGYVWCNDTSTCLPMNEVCALHM